MWYWLDPLSVYAGWIVGSRLDGLIIDGISCILHHKMSQYSLLLVHYKENVTTHPQNMFRIC
jgi:hypothetical protein